jgi:hypothetical protein
VDRLRRPPNLPYDELSCPSRGKAAGVLYGKNYTSAFPQCLRGMLRNSFLTYRLFLVYFILFLPHVHPTRLPARPNAELLIWFYKTFVSWKHIKCRGNKLILDPKLSVLYTPLLPELHIETFYQKRIFEWKKFLIIPDIFQYDKPIMQYREKFFPAVVKGRFRWSRGLRLGSAASRLLGLRVRIPPPTWMSLSCECCVLSGRGLRDELITRPEESYRV